MDLTHKWDFETLRSKSTEIKKIFFWRICGTGMGAAACLLKQKGFEVEGADHKFLPPMSQYLESTGIPCHSLDDITEKLIKTYDLIVVGNVVPRSSEDADFIERSGVPFISFPSALGALVLSEANVVGIAGTHGKTTTTYFFTQVFEKLGVEPGYFIGGVIEGRASSELGDGRYFFIESDEYDSAYFEKISKFRMYSIKHLILTSLEFDHADIFRDLEDIKNQFRALLPSVSSSLLVNEDYPAAKELFDEYSTNDELRSSLYGESSSTGPRNVVMESNESQFEVCLDNNWVQFKTNVIGMHNILNLTTVILFAFGEGFDTAEIKEAIKNLEMVKRRQEVRGYYNGCMVIDDFAHHPRAVSLTIEGVKLKYPGKNIVVIFEPHSATARSALFQKEFTEGFRKADRAIFTKAPKPTSVADVGDLDCGAIVSELEKKQTPGHVIETLPELRALLDKHIDEKNILLVLSNGTCLGLWESDFVTALK
jgi:UDP-N-acetylmuramate: L-alanyl-gamma-D-glutamyl-meso-diaminopimelate ligase